MKFIFNFGIRKTFYKTILNNVWCHYFQPEETKAIHIVAVHVTIWNHLGFSITDRCKMNHRKKIWLQRGCSASWVAVTSATIKQDSVSGLQCSQWWDCYQNNTTNPCCCCLFACFFFCGGGTLGMLMILMWNAHIENVIVIQSSPALSSENAQYAEPLCAY